MAKAVNIRDSKVREAFGKTAAVRLPVIGNTIIDVAQRNVLAMFKQRTGTLANSFEKEVRLGRRFPNVTVRNTADYSRALHDGAREHPIDARRGPNLVFWWQRKRVLFIGPHVDHPGVKGKPFLSNALHEVLGG